MQLLTVLRLCLATVIICTGCALPLKRPEQAVLFEESKVDAPLLKQLQETGLSGTRSNQFPANSVDALEPRREMRQAEATTTAQNLESSKITPSASGDNGVEQIALQSQRQLRDLLKHYYTNPRTGGQDQPGNLLVYFDLFATGPLSDDGDVIDSLNAINFHRSVCTRVAKKMNTNRNPKDLCHWEYTCDFNNDRFPSSIISATNCTAGSGARCVGRIQDVMTFTRTRRGAQATWTEAGEIPVVYAYTCRQRH